MQFSIQTSAAKPSFVRPPDQDGGAKEAETSQVSRPGLEPGT